MVTLNAGVQSSIDLAASSVSPQTTTASIDSFAEQLASALEAFLGQAQKGSQIEIDVNPAQGQSSGVRQFTVTIKSPSSTPILAPTPPAAPAAPPAPATTTAPPQATTNEEDAYWAAQPPQVQALRTIQDPAAAEALAGQLASQGFTIDREIMLDGWDPLSTMQGRQIYGYTWVPSLNQPSTLPPGVTMSQGTPYDPANPPPGSIKVTTDFAAPFANI